MHSSLSAFIMVVPGANAMLLQVTALREFLAVFSGNEPGLGITLSLWLLAGLLAPPLFSLIPVIRPLFG